MTEFKVFLTESFEKEFVKLPKQEQGRIEKAKEQLKINPFVGKPLDYKFFREKKIGNKRLYFLIYEEKGIVLLVAYGGKKNQHATINAIKASFQEFKEEIEKASLKPTL